MNPLAAIAFAIAIMVSAVVISGNYKGAHRPQPSDPIAQRIQALDVNGGAYSAQVKQILAQAGKDTVIVYRDTCRGRD